MSEQNGTLHARLSALAGQALPDWSTMQKAINVVQWERGTILMAQGVPDQSVRLVLSGLVRLNYHSCEGRRFCKSIVEAGEVFASLEALSGENASFEAEALTDVTCATLSYPTLRRLADQHLAWERLASAVFLNLARRKERREFELLTLSAEARWIALQRDRPSLMDCVSQQDLAELIGITPVALSRLKSRLNRR